MRDLLAQARSQLRYEPVEKRVRANLGDETVLDSTTRSTASTSRTHGSQGTGGTS